MATREVVPDQAGHQLMGAGLVKAAFTLAKRVGLDHAPTRLFVYMAVVAMDNDENPVYYGGRDDMARALGNDGEAGHKAVTRALAPLTAANLTRSTKASRGRRASHYLLDGEKPLRPEKEDAHRPVSNPELGDADRPVNNPERGTVSGRKGDGERSNAGRSASPLGVKEQVGSSRPIHKNEPNARSALGKLRAERSLPLSETELLDFAYSIGNGNPWDGYLSIKHATETPITGANNPAAVLRRRLTAA